MTNEFNTESAQNDILMLDRSCPCCGHQKVLLTPRETLVYHHLINGLTASQIGAIVSLSPKTVSTYKMRISKKLGMGTGETPHIALLIHYAKERAITIKRHFLKGENVSPEYLAGYLQAFNDFSNPDVRLITGDIGIQSERHPLPSLPIR